MTLYEDIWWKLYHTKHEATGILFLVTVGCFVCIVAPYWIRNFLTFHSYRKLALMRKRYQPVATAANILFMLGTVCYGLFVASIYTKTSLHSFQTILGIITPSVITTGQFLACSRFWMIYFNTHFSQHGRSNKWKVLIDPNCGNNDWFLKNKKTFGNISYVFNIAIILACAMIITVTASYIIGFTVLSNNIIIGAACQCLWELLALFISMYCYYKCNEIEDDFYLVEEWLHWIIGYIVSASINAIVAVILIISLLQYDNKSSNTKKYTSLLPAYCIYVSFIGTVIGFTILLYSANRWVIKKLKQHLSSGHNKTYTGQTRKSFAGGIRNASGESDDSPDNPDNAVTTKTGFMQTVMKRMSTESNVSVTNDGQTHERGNSGRGAMKLVFARSHSYSKSNVLTKQGSDHAEHQGLRLSKVLSNYDCLDIFIFHLSNEFSLECILSLIEFIQFREYLESIFPDAIQPPAEKVKIPSDKIPKSSIIYGCANGIGIDVDGDRQNDSKLFKAKEIAYALYNRFVAVGSEYEINISSEMRDSLIKMMDNKQQWLENGNNITEQQLYELFIPCMKEMYVLLGFSFQRLRFSKPKLLHKIENILAKEQPTKYARSPK